MEKNQPKVSKKVPNQYIDLLIGPCFQGVNILFVLIFKNEKDIKLSTAYHPPKVEIKD